MKKGEIKEKKQFKLITKSDDCSNKQIPMKTDDNDPCVIKI